MKIVTDQRGLYAIRWGIWPFYQYFDLVNPGFWWSRSDRFYVDCFSQKERAEAWYAILNPKVAVVILESNDKQVN